MSRYDIVVFGATGFTGQFVVEELAQISKQQVIRWAVSGRSESKIKATLQAAANNTGVVEVVNTPILIANVDDDSSLTSMTKQAKVVLNCVGPYRFYGETLVKACIANGAHHLDISGEPQYLENMQLKYNESAKSNKVFVIGSCGFDSIPAEMGLQYTQQQFKGQLNEVDAYMQPYKTGPAGKAHYGTWLSAIYGFAHRQELSKLRRQLYPDRLPKPQFPQSVRGPVFYSRVSNSWCVPFPGSDRSVVYRSQRFLLETKKVPRLVQFSPYLQMSSLINTCILLFMGIVFGLLANFRCGRYFLKTFPRLFSLGYVSHAGPSREMMPKSSFQITFVGRGWPHSSSEATPAGPPSQTLLTAVTGPEAGYVTCAICIVQAALTILEEGDRMPFGGGVYPPGAAFYGTNYIDRLESRGVKFSVLSNSATGEKL